MTNNIEKKFPETLSFQELKKLNAKPVKNMTYFKLEVKEYTGFYGPLEKDENGKIAYYILRNILHKGKIIEVY